MEKNLKKKFEKKARKKNGLTRKEKEQKERKNDKKQKNKSMSNDRKLKKMYKYADKIEKKSDFPSEDLYNIEKNYEMPEEWDFEDCKKEKMVEIHKRYEYYRNFLLWKEKECDCCDCRRRSCFSTKRLFTTPTCLCINKEGLQFSHRDTFYDKIEKCYKTMIRTHFSDEKFNEYRYGICDHYEYPYYC